MIKNDGLLDLFARSGLSIDRLRSFLLVVEAGGIARAAPRNPVRQSQLSRQLAELEEFFGVALAERRGRGLAVTAEGELLAGVVRATLLGLRDIAALGAAEATLSISLGAGDSVLHGWLLPRASRALAGKPAVTLRLFALAGEEVAARIADARLDFGIVRARDVPPRVRSRVIGVLEYALYVPRALRRNAPRATRDPLALFASLPFATQHGEPELAERLAAALRRAKISRAPTLECETFPQAQRAVQSGHFAAILPTLARAELPARDFEELPLAIFGPPANIHLAWHPRLERQRPRVAAQASKLVGALSR